MYSGHPGRDSTTTHLASWTFLNLEEDFTTPLLNFVHDFIARTTWRTLPNVAPHLGVELGTPFKLHLHELSFVYSFLVWRNSLGHFPFTNCRISWVGSCPEETILIILFHIRVLLVSFSTVLCYSFISCCSFPPNTVYFSMPYLHFHF